MDSLREQLTRVRSTIVKGQPRTIPILQVLAEIPDISKGDRLNIARAEVLKWASKRAGRLPKVAWDFASFDLDAPGNPASAVRLKTATTDYWVLRLNDMDKQVAGQVWTTEVTLVQTNLKGTLGIRQALLTRKDYVDFTPGVPGVVLQISDKLSLMQDVIALSASPWVLSKEFEVDRLVQLINHSSRKLPVIVIALPEGVTGTKTAAVDVDQLARKMLGIAHVAVVPGILTYRLTDLVGKRLSVFLGAVRTYRPSFDMISDSPFRHPLALPNAIASWADVGPSAFIDLLIRTSAQETLRWSDDYVPPFATVRQAALSQRREQAKADQKSDSELLTLAYEEIDSLKAERDDFSALAQEEERERELAVGRAEESEARELWLKERARTLEKHISTLNGGRSPVVPTPDSLKDIQDWSEEYLGGRVILTSKAVRAAKGADFGDAALVYETLLMMSHEYYDMRTEGGPNKTAAFNKKLNKLALENTRTGDEKRLGEEGDEFFVRFKGRRVLLSWHLKNGNSRDPVRCFRLYYFWSDEGRQVVVGSLPGHLHTRAT